jgi:predicted secreted protein
MSWFVGIGMYVVIWWVAIFAVLPWGVKPSAKGDPGHAAGAPANPQLLRKAAITTVVAGVLWLIVYWAVSIDLIDFRS